MLNKQLTKVANGIMTVGIPGYTGRIDYAGARTSNSAQKQPANFKPAPRRHKRTAYDDEMEYDRRWNEEMAEIYDTPAPIKYVPAKKKGFTIARPKLGEETTPNYIVSEPEVPQFNMPNIIGGNEVTPVDIGTPNIPALPEARKAQPLTGGDANAWRANASAALGKAAPGIAGISTGVRGGAMPPAPTPAPADAPIVRPKSNKPALGSVEDRKAVYAKAGQPVDAPIVRPVRPSRAERLANAAEATKAMNPASRTAAIGNAMMRGARPNAAPASAAVQPRTLSIKDITADDMRKYRKYTAAGNMNSEMDRWKTLQAMQGNRNASNKDYRAAKKRGEVK